jgi:16S rRNA G1207 methylase RsmC
MVEMADHYFSARPSSVEERELVTASVWGHDLELESATGVFASGRLDRGTAVLFRNARPRPEAKTLLDLGCGYGVISCALAAELPGAHIWAVDVNERALALTAQNAERQRFGARVTAVRPDDVPDQVTFDEIWSNPPIHIGKSALHALLTRWLARLAPGGRALLVVGKNLGSDSLQRWLGEVGYRCERLGSAKGFRVLQVSGGSRKEE